MLELEGAVQCRQFQLQSDFNYIININYHYGYELLPWSPGLRSLDLIPMWQSHIWRLMGSESSLVPSPGDTLPSSRLAPHFNMNFIWCIKPISPNHHWFELHPARHCELGHLVVVDQNHIDSTEQTNTTSRISPDRRWFIFSPVFLVEYKDTTVSLSVQLFPGWEVNWWDNSLVGVPGNRQSVISAPLIGETGLVISVW